MRDSLAGRLRRAFTVVLLGIGLTAAVTAAVFGYVFLKARPDTHRYLLAGQEARLAHSAMIDQETAIRGYLLSGQREYLVPYLTGRAALRQQEAALVHNVGTDPRLTRFVIGRQVAEQGWFDQWAVPAVDGQQARDPAQLSAFVARGKALFDAYRIQHARLTTAVDRRRDTAVSHEGIALGVGAGLDFLVLLATAIAARRQSHKLEAAVVRPVAEIVDVIGRVRDGDLAARPFVGGPSELREIGAGLTAMTVALADARLDAAYDSSVADDGKGPGLELELGRDLVGQAAKYGRTMTRGVDNVFRTATAPGVAISGIAVPMVVGARVIGVLKCFAEPPAVLSPMTTEVLETLASQAATAVEAARLHERTEELSQTDALTRLFNRRRLDADLESECYRARRYQRPLSFVMLDVDHFKRFNDLYGHQRGDEALEVIAKVIAETGRDSDTVYRFGGEELAVLCRETDLDGATQLAERLRAAVERRMRPESVTASFGVATVGPEVATPDELVQAADKALYDAKRAGRNRVVVAGTAGVFGRSG